MIQCPDPPEIMEGNIEAKTMAKLYNLVNQALVCKQNLLFGFWIEAFLNLA